LKNLFKEFKTNLKLALPVIAGMVGHTLVGVVDNVVVGKLGTTELAAVSLGNSFVFIGMSLGIGFSTVITPIISSFHSKNDTENGRIAFQNGVILCTILGLLLFGVLYASMPLLSYMKQSEDVVKLAKPFLQIVGFSLFPLVVFQAYKQFADGMSQTKYAMYATIIGNIINVVLNIVLVFGFWIFPKMGIIGSAIGTLIARVFMVIYMHYMLSKQKKFKPYFENFGWQNFQKKVAQNITKLGIPSAMQMFFEVALFTAAIWLCGAIGKTSQAANQVALSLASLTFMFAMGFSVTAMIRVGNYNGLKAYKSLKTVASSIFLMTIIIEIIFALMFMFGKDFFPTLFVNNNTEMALNAAEIKEVVQIASQLLLVAAFFQISDGLQVVVLGALRGLQDVKVPMYICFIAYWMVGFPVSYYLGMHTTLKAMGVWIGMLFGLTVAAGLLYWRFRYLTKKLIAVVVTN
jgi:multidrug resistance protein, MATE family